MGDHDQVEVTAAVPTQPPRGGVVGAGVDQDPGSWRLHQEGIALPDVDRRHPQLVGRQAPGHRRQHRHHERDDQHTQGQPTSPSSVRGQQPHGPGSRGDERDRPGHVDRPTAASQRLGDRQHDGRTRPGQRETPGGEPDVDDRQDRRDEGQRCRHDRRRYRHEVGGQAHEVELAEGGQEHGEHGELRADRDPDQRRHPPRHAIRHAVADHRGEQQHAGGRARGEDQAEGGGQAGIEQDQQQHGHRQGMTSVADLTPGAGQEEHQGHGARTQHARLEAREEGEPGHHHADRQPPRRGRQAEQPDNRQHPTDDDRHVRAGDGRQMRQARGLHGGAVRSGQQPRVPGHETDEESSRPLVEVAGGSPSHARPEPLRAPGGGTAGPEQLPRVEVEEHARVLLGEPGAVAPIGQRPCARRGPPPIAERGWVLRHHQRSALAHRGPLHPVDPDQDVPAAGDRPGLGHHGHRELCTAPPGGERRQQPRGCRVGTQGEAPRRRGTDDDQRQDAGGGTEPIAAAPTVCEHE